REFTTWTLGVQYFFNKKTRALINYEFRDLEAPELPSSAPPNEIGDSMDDRLSLQVLAIF
ncbi:MAG: porin, partial [Gammaproteobacteria bacterium]